MKRALTILNGFMHDFAAGIWAATLLAVWRLEEAVTGDEIPVEMLQPLQEEFFAGGMGCVAVVIATGAGRTFTYAYVGDVYGADAERLRKRMLIIKHLVLFTVFGLGIWWQAGLVYGS
jgi:putative copper export protein